MKYQPLPVEFYKNNRRRFEKHIESGSIVAFQSNDKMPTNADGTMPFRQNNDLLYLCGIDQAESILLLFPDHPSDDFREVLFIKETSELIAIWEGHKLSKKEAQDLSGIENIRWTSDFENTFNSMMMEAENVYLNANEHSRAETQVESRDTRFLQWCKKRYPLHNYKRAAPIMHILRSAKSDHEIKAMQKACDITEKGFRRVLSFIKPGVMEYEIEAEFLHEFVRNRSKGFAYEPIIASGSNSCVLHYIDNNKECKTGDILLLDVGAEYANYNADMTRSIPVNGFYSERQKAVYNSVLRVQRAAMDLLRPGTTIINLQSKRTNQIARIIQTGF